MVVVSCQRGGGGDLSGWGRLTYGPGGGPPGADWGLLRAAGRAGALGAGRGGGGGQVMEAGRLAGVVVLRVGAVVVDAAMVGAAVVAGVLAALVSFVEGEVAAGSFAELPVATIGGAKDASLVSIAVSDVEG